MSSLSANDKNPKKNNKKKKIYVSLASVSLKLKELKADEDFYKAVIITSTIAFRWQPIMTLVREGTLG